jgi:putative endonuclease
MFQVYAIESLLTGRVYIGQSHNIAERLKLHNQGYVKSTSRDGPWRLLAFENFDSRDEARWRERTLKKSKGRRTRWIEENRI